MANNIHQNINNGNAEVSFLDVFFYLIRKWPWFVLSVLLCLGLALYIYERTDRVYSQNATVFIKDPASKVYSASLDRYDSYINKVNVTNELYRFKSKDLLSEVVVKTKADISYMEEEGLHMKELYSQSPYIVTFLNALPSSTYSFKVTSTGQNTVDLSDFSNAPGIFEINLRDTVSVGGLILCICPTDYYGPSSVGKDIHVTKVPVSQMVSYFQSNLAIRQQEEDASILRFLVKDSSPLRAHEFLSTLISTYNQASINDKNQVTINTEDFINERLRIIEDELNLAEADIETFKIKNDLILGIGDAASQYSMEKTQYGTEVLNLENEIQIARYVKTYINSPTKELDLIPSNTGISSSAVEAQIAQYNSMRLRRNALVNEGGESNPVMMEMADALRQMKQNIIYTIDNYIADLNIRKVELQRRTVSARTNLASIPSKERQLLALERQQAIKVSLFNFLLNRREENAISRAMVDDNAQILDSPNGSGQPVSPMRNRIILLGLLIGLALPAVWLLMKLFLDNKVRTRRDIKDAVTVPFLGEIPYCKIPKEEEGSPVNTKTDNMIAEAFSILRTNLNFVRHAGKPVQVITVSSFNESSGKTFVTANLAMSLKRTGKTVVILDLDIRKATISKKFKCKKIGVTNYLSDPELSVDDIIQSETVCNQLDIVAAGPVAPNPAELLVDSRLDELVAVLRQRYDYVLVDNVPLGIVADAKISNRVADCTLFVARSGRIDRRQLQDLEEIYLNKDLVHLMLILNGTDSSLGYNYGYGYGYGYGHKYGYGSGYYGREKKRKGLARLFHKKR